jgi:flavin reductase (DIM6/NTAB) family NADH-FMN oxidoreductase RutF
MNSAVRNIRVGREVSSGEFRSALRHLTGGVSVITAGRGRDITGMTVTSVSSLSINPPTLICQHQPGVVVLAAAQASRRLRREHSGIGST